jgi:trypsin
MRRTIWLAALAACFALPGSAGAILGGQPDGNAHPYVGLVTSNNDTCSGVLISSTVMLTAAHCSVSIGTNGITGAPLVAVSFSADPRHQGGWHIGTFYADPAADVAIVAFTTTGCSPPASGPPSATCGPVSSSSYANLPIAGLVDTLDMKTSIDLVGYGVQGLVRGGGPPQNGPFGTRQVAQTTLIASNDNVSGDFLKLHSGVCFGDSGGPDLLAGTNVVLGVNSYVNDNVCAGVTYSARVDTPAVLAWIAAATSRFAT